MGEAFGVSVVTDPVYPYDESPLIDVVMSHITGSSIRWGSDPRITFFALSETAYLFLRVACHSLWPISISTSSFLSDVCFYMLSCQARLSAFLTSFFIL